MTKTSRSVGRIVAIVFALCTVITVAIPKSFAAPIAGTAHLILEPGKSVTVYDRVEAAATLQTTYANPFDPSEIATVLTATNNSGQTVRVAGFWFIPHERKQSGERIDVAPSGSGEWRFRFMPDKPGRWQIRLTASDKTGTTVLGNFTVDAVTGNRHGWIRRSTVNNRYLQYSDTVPYFLIGENVCWSGNRGLADYDEWFADLAASGGNFARLWMAFSPIESKASGLGRYDLKNAAYFDEVLKLAEKHGIVCMLAFGTYGEFTSGGFFNEGQWGSNPYNIANGGPVASDKPDNFFTDTVAKAIYKRRLAYIIARYGAYRSLGFWEFWNEKGGDPSWFAEMAKYVKSIDPYKHLVTNSEGTTGDPKVWQLPDFDLTQTHRYGDEGSIRDIAPGIADDLRAHDIFNKPHLMGEFGISWRRSDADFDPKGTAANLHNGLWASALSGGAGGASIWWWDNYVHPKNLYHEFTGLAKYAAAIDWSHRRFEPVSVPPPTFNQIGAETFGDLTLSPTSGWGEKAKTPVVIAPDGSTTGGPLLSVLFGPSKADLHLPLVFRVVLPTVSKLTLHIGTVSDSATLRVSVDGKTAKEFAFRAAPGNGDDYESTKQFAEYGGIYQAVFNKDRSVDLLQGKHTITLENSDGDWLEIRSYTFANAKSSRYAALRTFCLGDAASGETLLWLQDPESNWANDRANIVPKPFNGVVLTLPVGETGVYRVQWWDTRTGKVVKTETAAAQKSALRLTVPPFLRDIALRAIRIVPGFALSVKSAVNKPPSR